MSAREPTGRPTLHPPGRRPTDGAPVTFVFEGRTLAAQAGDTVASALLRNGVRVLGRSAKYHRPRGYRCGRGHCSACAMRIDGLPGVRACVTPVRHGMTVEREHAWPDAGHDLLHAAEALAPLMPPGFYYRRFRRSPRAFALAERAMALASGQGTLPAAEAAARAAAARCGRRARLDVLVVGGGVAGMSAALAAADAGVAVLLVEQDDRLGGRLGDARPAAGLTDLVTAHPGVEVLTGAEAVAWYEEGMVAVDRRPDLLLASPTVVVLATGAYDRGLPFPGWDLPGVMLTSGALRLIERHGLRPGSQAVVLTTDDHGHDVARRLDAAGVAVVGVADCRPAQAVRQTLLDETAALGATVVVAARGARAHGLGRVRALTVLRGACDARSPERRPTARFACDLVVVSAGVRPADDLAYQATARGSLVLAAGGGTDAGPLLAGLVAGARTADEAIAQGAAAGSVAARRRRAAADPA